MSLDTEMPLSFHQVTPIIMLHDLRYYLVKSSHDQLFLIAGDELQRCFLSPNSVTASSIILTYFTFKLASACQLVIHMNLMSCSRGELHFYISKEHSWDLISL